jgi:type II secretory pathway pseudopilin PulG
MSVRPTRLATAAVAGLALAVLAPTGAQAHSTVQQDLAAAKSALNQYKDEYKAIADGYLPTDDCVESPEGVMGYHYANPDLIDRELDPLRPEVLVYQPDGYGGRKLVAAEYFYVDADQDVSTDDDRPSLFGQPFDGLDPGQGPGLPVNYTLHVWFWQKNPDGLFSPWNPAGSCEV